MTRVCAFCGTSLGGRRRHARHCSGACRAAASRARAESREAAEKAHTAVQARRTDPWIFPRYTDEFFAAVLEAFPGSYEELPAPGHRKAPLEA